MHMRITLPLLLLSLTTGLFAESTAGLHWTAPPGWTSQGPQPMRTVTYTISAAAGDHDNGECGVYLFGTGQGGSIDANIERWKSQFRAPDGKPAVAKVADGGPPGLRLPPSIRPARYSGMGGPLLAVPQSQVTGFLAPSLRPRAETSF